MTLAPILAVVTILIVLSFIVWRARPENSINRWFSSFTLAAAIWAGGIVGTHGSNYPELFLRLTFAAASFIPPTFLHFTYYYPVRSTWPPRMLLRFHLAAAVIFSLLSIVTPLLAHSAKLTSKGLVRATGPLYPAFAVYLLGTLGLSVLLLIWKWAHARGSTRRELGYFATGLFIASAGASTTNLLIPLITGNSGYATTGPYFLFALIAFVAHSIIRHRSLDLRFVVHRSLTLAVSVILSLVPIVVLLAMFWPRIAAQFDSNEVLILLVAMTVATLLVPPIRDVVSRLLDTYLYRAKTDYRATVRETSKVLTQALDLRVLLSSLHATIFKSLQCERVVVYLRGQDGQFSAFDTHAIGGTNPPAPNTMSSIVVAALTAANAPLLQEPGGGRRSTRTLTEISRELQRLNWALVLPVLSENNVIAAIVLGPKLSGDPFYPQDLDLLTTLANQAGTAIKNVDLYAQVVLANEYIENIVATIESGVVAVNAGGQVTMFNRAAEELTGLTRDSVLLQPLAVLPGCLKTVLQATLGDGQACVQPEVQLPAVSGTSRPVICTTSPLRDPEGTTLGAVAVFSDLTPLKELEVERQRVERLQYFEVLAAGIAHEIKNPLVAIKTFAQLIPRRHSDERFVNDFSRVVTREIGRMEHLVGRLRGLAQPAERPRYLLDLRLPINDAVEFLKPAFEDKQLGLTLTGGAHPYMVLGDHGELEQLFINLLLNAQEATPAGGQVSIQIDATGDQATVMIADTGPGIPAAILERVFDPFFTTKPRGSGLGLAICSRIAAAHDARLRAANQEQGGAVFTVDFVVSKTAEVSS